MTDQNSLPTELRAEALSEIMANLTKELKGRLGIELSADSSDAAAIAAEKILDVLITYLQGHETTADSLERMQKLGLGEETARQIAGHVHSRTNPTAPP